MREKTLFYTSQVKLLTMYATGPKENPPIIPRIPPKKGNEMAINIVKAESQFCISINQGDEIQEEEI